MAKKSIPNFFGSLGEKSVEPHPTLLTLTPRTIQLGHGSEIFPISNLTRFGKYKVSESKTPLSVILVCFLIGLGALILGVQSPSLIGVIIGVIFLLVSAYGIHNRTRASTFAFGFETSSGATRYLYTKKADAIDKFLTTLTDYIESDQNGKIEFNFRDGSVHNYGVIGGNVTTGDLLHGKGPSKNE